MVDPLPPTVYWPENVISQCDLTFVKDNVRYLKGTTDEQWEKLKNFFEIYPDFFNPERTSKEVFVWATSFINSRCFGWGLPATMLVPMADCLNHSPSASFNCEFLEKNLHRQMNKIYLYKHNWKDSTADDEDEETQSTTAASAQENDEDKVYDKTKSKIRIVCPKLFEEDEIASLPAELLERWQANRSDDQLLPDGKKPYSRDLCLQRFKFNHNKYCPAANGEEEKVEDEEPFGQ